MPVSGSDTQLQSQSIDSVDFAVLEKELLSAYGENEDKQLLVAEAMNTLNAVGMGQ